MKMKDAIKPQAFWTDDDAPRRRFRRGDCESCEGEPIPGPIPESRRGHCPNAIISRAPDDSGLGVWVLLEETVEGGEVYCTYEYAGGIA